MFDKLKNMYDTGRIDEKYLIQAIKLGWITEKEKNTIRLRFGFEDGHCKSLEEIGEIFCFTRERIRLLESRALCKIRRSPSIKKLKDYSFL